MKTSFRLPVAFWFCLSAASLLHGQQPANSGNAPALPSPTPYVIVEQDANSQVWQQETYDQAPDGSIVTNIHKYTELATGLNHLVNGQWVASKEEIDISPDGNSAAATNGQHQAYFPGDIAQGVIELDTPDGLKLQSRPIALSYDDGSNTVLIAVLTNSPGYLFSANQVIYPNAFMGVQADLLYTYTKAGFEQDIILRAQPPTPESFGLNPQTARLQVLTEFFNPPQPTITATTLPEQAGISLTDENLNFGVMGMIPGRAFLLGSDAHDAGVLVSKSWVTLQGKQFLVEEAPVEALADELAQLPVSQTVSTKPNVNSALNVVSAKRLLPAPSRTKTGLGGRFMPTAQATAPSRGLVLDYVTLSGGTAYTFRGDTTYYVSGGVSLFDTNTFEGGAVIKYATNGVIYIVPGPPGTSPGINWKGSAYRPVIFTAKDDNSVGESIGTGNPTGYYGLPMLEPVSFSPQTPLVGLRMAYAKIAIVGEGMSANLYDVQFVNCQIGLILFGGPVLLGNALFANTTTNFCFPGGVTIIAQNTTFSGSLLLALDEGGGSGPPSLTLTNCILANVTNISYGGPNLSGGYNGFYNSPEVGANPVTNSFNPFQSVGAGNYYLTNGCSFFNAGTTNIDPTLLASLPQKTTYPPLLLTNQTVAINTALSPQAQRDTSATLDLGYHYDPIDYIVDNYAITNATLTVNNGTAIACYNELGIQLQNGSSIVSIGTPLYPNWFVRYQSVQEQSIQLGGTNVSAGQTVSSQGAVSAVFQFSKFACPAGGGDHLYDASTSTYSNLLVQECEFWSGQNYLTGSTNTTATLMNNLFYRSSITASNAALQSTLGLSNNLVYGTTVNLFQPSNTVWYAFNNDFDTCTITNSTLTNGYNAYLACTNRLYPTNANDIVTNVSLAYQTGPLGSFYQPTNSPLLNKGSTTANQVGLYHYTVTTNEVIEGTNIVSIGYHYVAVTNGVPLDSNGDGVPDYLEDANGNGLVDSGEIGWNIPGDLGLQVLITQPRNGSTLP